MEYCNEQQCSNILWRILEEHQLITYSNFPHFVSLKKSLSFKFMNQNCKRLVYQNRTIPQWNVRILRIFKSENWISKNFKEILCTKNLLSFEVGYLSLQTDTKILPYQQQKGRQIVVFRWYIYLRITCQLIWINPHSIRCKPFWQDLMVTIFNFDSKRVLIMHWASVQTTTPNIRGSFRLQLIQLNPSLHLCLLPT